MSAWRGWAAGELEMIRSARLWREVRDLDGLGPRGRLGGREVISFAGNDYLGLASHPLVIQAASAALARWGVGATASRLLAGSRPIQGELEEELAAWKGEERALLFSSGYTANLGVLTTLGGPGSTIVSDELNHASIVDGCRLARAEVRVYRHLDLSDLRRQLQGAGRTLVVTESVFSMDGEAAPLQQIAEECRRAGALMVVDEAHAVFGSEIPPTGIPLLKVGTLSKFLGSAGGFVAGPSALVELIRNRARSFIFTTASPPALAAAALAALQILRGEEGALILSRLRAAIDSFRRGHPSPVIPVLLGGSGPALEASRELLDRGLWVPAIRPPSVPSGTERLRISLSAAHKEEELRLLRDALAAMGLLP